MKTLFAFLLLAGLSSAWAIDPDFILVNQTNRSFEGVYITALKDKDWNGNLLANGEVLKPGEHVKVIFPKHSPEMEWDLNVVDDAGLSVEFHKLNLKHVETVDLVDKDGKVTAVVK
ncbi:hypothetical protein BH09VER1_BH09VER1_20910 [soil metagenome]